MTVPESFAKKFAELRRLSDLLDSDVDRALDELQQAYDRYAAGSQDVEDLNYAVKTMIRCQLGAIDGTSFALRDAVAESAHSMKLQLSAADKKFLRRKKLNPRKSLSVGHDFFAQLCGAPLRLDTSGTGWTAFDHLVEARNDFTHPDDILDILAVPALRYVKPTLIWYPQSMAQLLRDCGVRLNLIDEDLAAEREVTIELEPALLDMKGIFNDEFFQAVADSPGRSIAYLQQCLSILSNETSRAMSDCKSPFLSAGGQYELRRLVRTLYSNIEGMANFLCGELEKTSRRGEVVLTSTDRESMTSGEIEERLVATVTIWSREVGFNRSPPRDKRFAAVSEGRGIRNRLTHPRKVGDLRLGLKEIDIIIEAAGWFNSDVSQALPIDAEKWIEKFRASGGGKDDPWKG